jgi:hypothetical protein
VQESGKRYRVVVVGVDPSAGRSPDALAAALADHLPLPEDARLAIESGRSAVVQTAATETYARRTATLIIKLGAEVRIEPEGGGAAPSAPPETPSRAEGTARNRSSAPGHAPSSRPFSDVTEPVVSERPLPRGEEAPAADKTPAADTTSPVESPEIRTDAAGPVAEPDADYAVNTDATVDGAKPHLVRCPAHGLLYDAAQSAGCSRCLGMPATAGLRLAPGLRRKPRLWLTTGMLLALLLGAVPAALYTRHVKNGPLLEQRIEAASVRSSRVRVPEARKAYAAARAEVGRARTRGVAVSAVLWLGSAALLLLLWYRFV